FQHERHWIEPGKLVAEERPDNSAEGELVRRDFEDWFSTPVWKPEPLKTETELDASKRWLIFADAFGIGTAAAKLLSAAGCRVAIVSQAEAYSSPEPDRYCLAPGEKDHFEQLFLDLTSREQIPDRILYLWTLTDDSRIAALDSLQSQLDLSFFTPLFLLQTLASEASGRRIRLAIATNRLHRVKDEPCVRIERAAAIGPCRVTPHELPELSPVNVDLALAPEQLGQLTHDHTRQAAATLIQEINADSRERLVAYRDARYVQRAEALRLSPGKASPKLRPNGVYLITGGLGALGLLHAKYLAQTAQARLVLCGRFGLPDRTDWENWISTYGEQDAITQKIRTVLELEAAGAQVVIAQGDINNPNRVRDIVLQCGRDLGPINGVIHAAGVLDDGPLQLKDRYISGRVLSSKIQGTLVLAEALRDEKLDFFVLFSSTSSLLGPPGQIDYTSANAFLNAFAGSGLFPNTSAIQWGVWKEVGMAAALRNKLAARASALSEEEQNGHAILGELVEQSDQEIIYAAAHEASSHWVFSGHRVQGSAILPGTGHIELAVAAALTPDRGRLVRIRNLSFIEPLVVPEDEKACIRVSLSRSGDTLDFSVMSAQGDEWIEHSSAEVEIRPSDPNPHTTSLDALTSRCNLQRFDLP
ncbi:MAG TPA: SDR family NAD(P)-dependent oxidoreductase, partial [Bryobacteraceae bacterium]|nr:SDR family NAD(P)-dependent oxidoreductase [Bryobacteraceae bacterium]